MNEKSGRRRRIRLLWGLSVGLLLIGGVIVHVVASSDPAEEWTHDARPHTRRPVADAGDNFNAVTGAPAILDGSAGFDRDARLLTFHWRLQHAPKGSAAVLTDPTKSNPVFIPDVPGKYKFGASGFSVGKDPDLHNESRPRS